MVEVRIPPGNRMLSFQMAEKLIKSAWYEAAGAPPDKLVILVDADGADPDEVLAPFKENLPGRLGGEIRATVLYAYAQWRRPGTPMLRTEATWVKRPVMWIPQSRTRFRTQSSTSRW